MSEILIQAEGLTYRYNANGRTGSRAALSGVTFQLREGERVGLVGPNGAGKSTLFLCLTGILDGFTGELRVAGHSPGDRRSIRTVRDLVGIVFQATDDQLFSPTVLDDAAFGPRNQGASRDEAVLRAREALGRVGFPPSLETAHPHELSGGERRRVALAGVLAMNPRVLLLDEPGSDLDPRGKRGLIELLNSLGGTQIIAAHDLELIRRTCPRTMVMDEGRIVADGATDALLGDAALMEAHGLEVPASLK